MDNDQLSTIVEDHLDRIGRPPSGRELAALAGVSLTTAHASLRRLRLAGVVGGGPPRSSDKTRELKAKAMDALRSYIMSEGWAPSQRELASLCGVGLQRIHSTLAELEAEGLLEIGAGARAIRIVGTNISIPETKGSTER